MIFVLSVFDFGAIDINEGYRYDKDRVLRNVSRIHGVYSEIEKTQAAALADMRREFLAGADGLSIVWHSFKDDENLYGFVIMKDDPPIGFPLVLHYHFAVFNTYIITPKTGVDKDALND